MATHRRAVRVWHGFTTRPTPEPCPTDDDRSIDIPTAPVVTAVCNLLESDPDAELRIRTPRAGGISIEYRRRGRHVQTHIRGAVLAQHPGGPDGALADALDLIRTSREPLGV